MFSTVLLLCSILMTIGFIPYAVPLMTYHIIVNLIQIWFHGMCDDKNPVRLLMQDRSIIAEVSNSKNPIGYHGVLTTTKVTLSKKVKDTFKILSEIGHSPLVDSHHVTVSGDFVFLIKEEKENIKEINDEFIQKTVTRMRKQKKKHRLNFLSRWIPSHHHHRTFIYHYPFTLLVL